MPGHNLQELLLCGYQREDSACRLLDWSIDIARCDACKARKVISCPTVNCSSFYELSRSNVTRTVRVRHVLPQRSLVV